MLDDLTNQLVKALDTSDVVGWKSSEAESPFGKNISKKFFEKIKKNIVMFVTQSCTSTHLSMNALKQDVL